MRSRNTRLGERGEAAAIEMIAVLAFLLIPTLVAFMQVPRWIDARSTAELAAAEAARLMVLAPDYATGAATGRAAALRIVENHGWPATALHGLEWSSDTELEGGQLITATVTMEVPAIVVPYVGRFRAGGTFSASHTELVDQFRSFDR